MAEPDLIHPPGVELLPRPAHPKENDMETPKRTRTRAGRRGGRKPKPPVKPVPADSDTTDSEGK